MRGQRWFVGWVLDPALAPVGYRDEAQLWRDQPLGGRSRSCWTFRGAQRLARRWNRGYTSPGLFEVFGPAGKDAP